MSVTKEKIMVTGATGNIGSVVVKGLVKASIPTTVFVRDEEKTRKLFEAEFKTGLLNLVVGDQNDIEAFKKAIVGHSRLFLLVVVSHGEMPTIKANLGKLAVDAGVRQIIDLSSISVSVGADNYIGLEHTLSETILLNLIGTSCNLVILRPSLLFTNNLNYNVPTIKSQSKIYGVSTPSERSSFVSTDDIGDIAVSVFLDPIEKHRTTIYNITSEILSNEELAQIYSRVFGREITYVQVPPDVLYNQLIQHVPHTILYTLVGSFKNRIVDTPEICILLKKAPRKFEDWVKENKSMFV